MVSNPVGNRVLHTCLAFGIIDTVAVALRIFARRRSNAAFAADDALIIASLVPFYSMMIIDHFSVKAGGMGLSTAVNLELGGLPRISTLLKLLMSAIVTYTLTMTLVKLSLLSMYRRIFFTTRFKHWTLIVGVTVMLWFIISLFTDLFQCRPFQAAFNPELLFTNKCINLQAYYRGITASNLCLDVILLYMPLHMVWGLKLRTRQKIEVSGLFLLGGITCVAAAMRLVAIGNLQSDDITYSVADAYLWSQIEPALAILCACIMTLRPLLADLHLHFFRLSTHFTRSKGSSSSSNITSTELTNKAPSRLQWPGIRAFSQKDSTKLSSSRVTSPDPSLQAVTVDMEIKDQKGVYAQVSEIGSKDSTGG